MTWQTLAGPLVGILGLTFAIYAFIANRKPKRLHCETIVDQEISPASRYSKWSKLSVQFGQRHLSTPRIVGMQIINSGKVEARPDDFDEPLTIRAREDTEIVACTITAFRGAKSSELEPSNFSTKEIIAPPVLLNPDDRIEFHMLVDGGRGPLEARARIAGFTFNASRSRHRFFSPKSWNFGRWDAVVVAATVVTIGAIVTSTTSTLSDNQVQIPNVVGVSTPEAIDQINSSGLKVSSITEVEGSPTNQVLSESPAAGTSVSRGSGVLLVVARG